jgi:anti-sigma B factor antagonist
MSNPSSFRIDGELTIYRAAELCDALKAVMAGVPDGDELAVDLSDVTEMDSAGVQLLMAAKKTARASGRDVRITGRSPAVEEVLETLRLGAHFADVSTSPLAASNS